jgi:hypothetical protein
LNQKNVAISAKREARSSIWRGILESRGIAVFLPMALTGSPETNELTSRII